MGSTIAIVVLIVLVLLIVVRNIYVVQQSKAYVIERLGAFHSVWGVGLHLKVPFIERVVKKVSLKEQVADFDPQPVITKDNVTMQIDTVIYFQITDPRLYTYGVEYPMNAIENLTATTLRNIIGELELDQSLTSRDTINAKMRTILDEATDPWGIKVNRVELKNILPPREIQNAMEKQMKAERERRESILQAEGEKASKILVAEGSRPWPTPCACSTRTRRTTRSSSSRRSRRSRRPPTERPRRSSSPARSRVSPVSPPARRRSSKRIRPRRNKISSIKKQTAPKGRGLLLYREGFRSEPRVLPTCGGKNTLSGPTSTVGSAEASTFGPRPAQSIFAAYTPQKTDFNLFAACEPRAL